MAEASAQDVGHGRRRAVALVVVVAGVLTAVGVLTAGWLLQRVTFTETTAGDGWRLLDRAPTGSDEVVLEASLDGAATVLSFSVSSATGGVRECRQPTVILDGVDRRSDRVVAELLWRERGCAGEWQLFTVELDDPGPDPFVFEWLPAPEAACAQFVVTGDAAEPLADGPPCTER